MANRSPDYLRDLFAGFRHNIDRLALEHRRTGVKRASDPRAPHRFVVRQKAADVIDLAARRVCRAHGLPAGGPERAA